MNAPSRAALATLVALVALGGAFLLGLYAITTPDQRPELLGKLAAPLAATVAAVPAFLAWLASGQLRRVHDETAAAVTRVEHATNGHLTERLRQENAAANAVLRDELLAALQVRRATDEPFTAAVPNQRQGQTFRESPLVTGMPLAGYDPPAVFPTGL